MLEVKRLLAFMRLIFITLFVLCLSDQASGALGEIPSAFRTAPALLAVPSVRMAGVQINGYTIHETTLESGTRIQEYASLNGVVFAVAWRGPVLPDLNGLLGNYFKSFKVEAERAHAAGRRNASLNVAYDGLVLQSSGRMRDFFGHAFVPALVPPGVPIDDVLR